MGHLARVLFTPPTQKRECENSRCPPSQDLHRRRATQLAIRKAKGAAANEGDTCGGLSHYTGRAGVTMAVPLFSVRGHTYMTSAKFSGFLTPSLPLSEFWTDIQY